MTPQSRWPRAGIWGALRDPSCVCRFGWSDRNHWLVGTSGQDVVAVITIIIIQNATDHVIQSLDSALLWVGVGSFPLNALGVTQFKILFFVF